MAGKKRLSVCMVTQNDEKYIAGCLQAIKELADEIILADTGSTDKTVAVAGQAGARVYPVKWNNSRSEAKNLCLDQAQGRWVLFLQANETIPAEQLKEVKPLLDNPNAEGYLFYIDRYSENYRISSPVQSLRLFRNRKEYRYKYRACERIPEELLANVKDSGIRIFQQEGPNLSSGDADQLSLLLKEDLKEYPEDGYLQYVYGIELLNRKQYEKSIEYFQRARKSVNHDYLYAPHLYKCLGWSFISLRRQKDALDVLEEGISYFPFYTDLLVLRGELRKHFRQYEEAIRDMERCLKIREASNTAIPVPDINTPVILESLGEIHEEVFNYRLALACYRQSYELRSTGNITSDSFLGNGAGWSQAKACCSPMHLPSVVPRKRLPEVILSPVLNRTNSGLLRKIGELAAKQDPEEMLENLLKTAMEQNNLEQLMHIDADGSQPLGALEYVLWAKGFMKKLERWLENMRQKMTGAAAAGASKLPLLVKAGKALAAFYYSLGVCRGGMDAGELETDAEKMPCSEIHGEIGRFYEKAGKKREAFHAYLQALQWDPLNAAAQEGISGMFREDSGLLDSFPAGNGQIREGSWFHGREELVNYVLGFIHFKKHQFGQTIAFCSKIAEAGALYPIALAYIIGSLWLTGREAEAESRLKVQAKAAEVLPQFFHICKSYALDKLAEGRRQYPYSEILLTEKQKLCKKDM